MLVFVARRLLVAIPILVVSSVLVFLMVALSGDPLGQLRQNPNVSQATLDARRHDLNLDKPLVTRYFVWAGNFVRGDFGTSLQGFDVRERTFAALAVTTRMVLLAMTLALVLAIITGVISAVKQYSVTDYAITFLGFLFISTPLFWLAGVLKEWGAIRLNNLLDSWFSTDRRYVYTIGERTPDFTGTRWQVLQNYGGHVVLPVTALALITYAAWSRFQRASMLEVLNADYMRLARAKGVPWRRVLVRHGLRTALIPLVTTVAVTVGLTLGGAVITETVFGWNGMGKLLTDSVRNLDVNAVLAWLMVSAIFVILANLIADVLYAYLDPRIRRS